MTEEEIITNVGLDLQDCFPEVDIFSLLNRDISGKPSAKITIWGKNEFVRGGLSYIKLDQNNSLPVELVRPTYASSQETPGLFWAGEAAAIYEQPASVHGAYSAGLRASVEIEHFLNDKILNDEKQIAQIYHQKFGLKKEMDWHSNIVRSAQEGDTEVDWQDKFSVLLEEDRV